MASCMPAAARWRRRSMFWYASGVATSVSMARVATPEAYQNIERADHLVAAAGDVRHRLLGAADGGHGHAAAHRLGQGDHVGLDVLQARDAPRADGEAGLDLVEGEQRAVIVEEGLEARE